MVREGVGAAGADEHYREAVAEARTTQTLFKLIGPMKLENAWADVITQRARAFWGVPGGSRFRVE